MARVVGVGIGAVQLLLVLSILYNQLVTSDSAKHKGTQQDYQGTTEITQLYSYRTLVNFNGFYFVSSAKGTEGFLRISRKGTTVTGSALGNIDRRQITSTKYDTITCILINMLARSGYV